MGNEILIKVENLSKSFGDNEVLSNVNMQIEKGEVIAISDLLVVVSLHLFVHLTSLRRQLAELYMLMARI